MRGNISARGILALLAILCLTAGSAQAVVILVSDNPATDAAWELGDTYRFAFVSSETTQATSTDITTYNAFVQGLADVSPLNIGASNGFTWNVIGSTSTVDAIDNTSSNTAVNGSGEATLLLDGMTVIANDYADLWNNNIDNPLNMNENGVGGLTGNVFTGSFATGTKETTRFLGGSTETPPKVTHGRMTDTSAYWMRVYNAAATSSLSVYAMSDPVSLGGELAYWDLNGSDANSGSATPTGTWDGTNTYWNATADGTGTTAAWSTGKSAVFSAGDDASGAYTVTVSDTQDITGLGFEEGTVTITGGTALRLVNDAPVVVNSGLTATVETAISDDGNARQLAKYGEGTLILSGTNTYTGATSVVDGTLEISGSGTHASPVTTYGGTLNVNAGTVTTLNVPGGTANLNTGATATTANVSGTGLLALGGTTGSLNVTGGTVNVNAGGTATTATLSGGTVDASSNALPVTDTLATSGHTMAYTAGGSATSFSVGGTNIGEDNTARTVTLSGGQLNITNDAATIPSSTVVWLDASNIDGSNNSTLTNGASVATWTDATVNGNDATQTNSSMQPTYVESSGLNGKPAVRFTNPGDSGQRMEFGDLSAQFGNSEATVIGVSTLNNDGRYNLFGNRNNDSRWVADTWNESSAGEFRGGRNTSPDGNTPWPTTGNHIFTLDSGTDLYQYGVDGTTVNSSTTQDWNNGSGQNWTLGDRVGGGQALNGDIAEFLIFNQMLTTEEMNNIGGYLATKYGITGTGYTGSLAAPAVNLPNTAVAVTDDSTLALDAGLDHRLGTLTLSGGSQLTLSGATNVSFAGFTGTGSVVGTVTVPAGGNVSPGTDTTISTLEATGLTLDSGSLMTFNITDETTLDQIDVTGTDGLSVFGGGITLLDSTGAGTFSDQGTYNLIGYVGALGGGLDNLVIVNKIVGRNYVFGTGSGFVTLTIGESGYWNGDGGTDLWSNSANWAGIAPGTNDTLVFATAGGDPAITTLNNDIVGGSFGSLYFFTGAPAFTLQGNDVTLTGDGTERTVIANDSTETQTVDLNIALGNNATINATSGDIVVNGDISGAYSLTKTGDGTLTLSGSNSYSGGTTVDAGALVLGSSGTLGAAGGDLAIGGGSSLDLGTTSQTVDAVSVTAPAASGDAISNGSLTATSYAVSNAAGEVVISANLGGAADLTKTGDGAMTLSGTNTYTGLTDIQAGTVKLGSAGALGGQGSLTVDGTLDLNDNNATVDEFNLGGSVLNNGTAASVLTVNSGILTSMIVDGSSGGTVALVKEGDDALQFGTPDLGGSWTTANKNYINSITSLTVNGGMIVYCGNNAFGSATLTMADGTALKGFGAAEGRYGFGNEDLANDIVLTGGTVNLPLGWTQSKDIWLKGTISGAGGLSITGSHRVVTLSNDNTFEGGVSIQCGTSSPNKLQLASYTGLGTGTLTADQGMNNSNYGLIGVENLDGIVADINGVSSASGVTNAIEILAGKYLGLSTNNAAKVLLLSGPISGEGTLHKTQVSNVESTVILAGANTYTGGTLVNYGTLTINGSLADSSMDIDNYLDTASAGTVNGSGTLTFNIEDTTCDLIRVMDGGTLDITNLIVDINAANLTESSYVLVDWEIEAAEGETAIEPGILIGDEFASEVNVPTGWKIDYGSTQITLVPGQLGDTNLDGVVDAIDYMAIKRNFGMASGAQPVDGDVNNDGRVDWDDLQILQAHFGEGSLNANEIPEPATMMLLLTAGLPALLKRRRNQG